jgi:ribosomal protein S27AE
MSLTVLETIPADLIALVEALRDKLHDSGFVARHRVRTEDFTRHRQLTFPVVMLFVLQKTVKSIHRHLVEFLDELCQGQRPQTPTTGAWTHARAKLKHTAFIEINEQVVLPALNRQTKPIKRWRGHRLFGHDSSLVRLPDTPELAQEFGRVEVHNHRGATGTAYAQGRMSVLYDLLNRVGIDARLEPSKVGEVALAIQQSAHVPVGEIVLNDRGFTGYRYVAEHVRRGVHVVGRCSTGSFLAAQEMFRLNCGGQSKVAKIFAPRQERAELAALGLPLELVVRFVSLRLPDGKLEVLLTTLLDEGLYPTEEFLDVYHYRWNHETFYNVLKGRLELENFSGETAEAIRQDFHAAVLLCSLESLLIRPAQNVVEQSPQGTKHPQKLNQADAYHALKMELLQLLYSQTPAVEVIRRLQCLFVANPMSVPVNRKVPRRTPSFHRSYHFQRRVKKIVF